MQEAIVETGRVRGPVFTVPSAIEFDRLHALARDDRHIDILVAALKAPELGGRLAARLVRPGRAVELVDSLIPRQDFLTKMSDARVTLFLPWKVEGFYIPAIEGMAVGTLVVCPDIVVNRSFCIPGVNCFRPEYEEEALAEAAESALSAHSNLDAMRDSATETARKHDLSYERAAVRGIISRLDELWASC